MKQQLVTIAGEWKVQPTRRQNPKGYLYDIPSAYIGKTVHLIAVEEVPDHFNTVDKVSEKVQLVSEVDTTLTAEQANQWMRANPMSIVECSGAVYARFYRYNPKISRVEYCRVPIGRWAEADTIFHHWGHGSGSEFIIFQVTPYHSASIPKAIVGEVTIYVGVEAEKYLKLNPHHRLQQENRIFKFKDGRFFRSRDMEISWSASIARLDDTGIYYVPIKTSTETK